MSILVCCHGANKEPRDDDRYLIRHFTAAVLLRSQISISPTSSSPHTGPKEDFKHGWIFLMWEKLPTVQGTRGARTSCLNSQEAII